MLRVEAPEGVGEIVYGQSISSVAWSIPDYFAIPQDIDRSVESPTFNFFGAVWCLRLYPNGQADHKSAGCVSLYLVKKQPKSLHQMQFEFAIVRRNGCKVRRLRWNHLFKEINEKCGLFTYLNLSELSLQRGDLVPDGVLTISCTIAANTRCEYLDAGVQTEKNTGMEKLVQDFKDLLLNGEATDVTLKVGNVEYKVHSAVLVARSTVFSAMMRHDWKEKSSGVVQIDDCDPEAFRQFLTYLYSGDPEDFSSDTVSALQNIADKYDAQDLKTNCVQFMQDNLSVDIFCDVLSLSLRHNESELKEKAFRFFAENAMDILVSVKWLSFVKENPTEANELYIKYVTITKPK